MGFIKAFAGALGGTFADQWIDIIVPADAPGTAGVIPAVQKETNAGRGSNTKGSEGIITNGSKILIPDGYALITFQNQAVTGFVSEPGGFVFTTEDPNAQSIFTGGGLIDGIIKQAFERFKYGGVPGSRQGAVYVNLKEIPNNKFGTQSEIQWDDAYINAQVAAVARGVFSLKITDPITFLKGFVPVEYYTSNRIFDFADIDNPAVDQLFNEVVSSLGGALSRYCNDPAKGNRMASIQSDQVGFAKTLSDVVEEGYQWKTDRGLEIAKVAITIEYDEDTKALLSDVRKADALSGQRGNSFLQQSVARGMQAAGENGGGAMGIGMMGMGMNMAGSAMAGLQQPVGQQATEDPVTKLKQMKELLDAGVITQEEFDAAKAKFLG